MKWFKVNYYRDSIEEIEVVKTTNSYVVLISTGYDGQKHERRARKSNEWFHTMDAAKDAILTRLARNLKNAESALDDANRRMAKFMEGIAS